MQAQGWGYATGRWGTRPPSPAPAATHRSAWLSTSAAPCMHAWQRRTSPCLDLCRTRVYGSPPGVPARARLGQGRWRWQAGPHGEGDRAPALPFHMLNTSTYYHNAPFPIVTVLCLFRPPPPPSLSPSSLKAGHVHPTALNRQARQGRLAHPPACFPSYQPRSAPLRTLSFPSNAWKWAP